MDLFTVNLFNFPSQLSLLEELIQNQTQKALIIVMGVSIARAPNEFSMW